MPPTSWIHWHLLPLPALVKTYYNENLCNNTSGRRKQTYLVHWRSLPTPSQASIFPLVFAGAHWVLPQTSSNQRTSLGSDPAGHAVLKVSFPRAFVLVYVTQISDALQGQERVSPGAGFWSLSFHQPMGAAAGDVMLLPSPVWRTWGWGLVGGWIFCGLYWTRFFSPAIYVLSLKFRLSQECDSAAFKTGFRAVLDKPDNTASGQKTRLQSGVGFMWLPRESFKWLHSSSVWGDPKLEREQSPWHHPFLRILSSVLNSTHSWWLWVSGAEELTRKNQLEARRRNQWVNGDSHPAFKW